MAPQKRAIGYARVSTEDKGQTTKTQIDAIKKWARENGVIIEAIYDDNISGEAWPRPGLMCAIGAITAGYINEYGQRQRPDYLVAYDPSRITRNAGEQLPIIRGMLGLTQIRYVVDGAADAPVNIGVEIMHAVRGITDHDENRVRNAKTSLRLEQLKRDGQHVGRPARFMFSDDIATAPAGKYQRADGTITAGGGKSRHYVGHARGTKTISRAQLLEYAGLGWSVCYVARNILGISPSSLARVMAGDPDNGHPDIREEYRARYIAAKTQRGRVE